MREAFAGRGKRGNEGQCVHIQDNGCRAERKHHRGGVGGTGEGGGEGGRGGGEKTVSPKQKRNAHVSLAQRRSQPDSKAGTTR